MAVPISALQRNAASVVRKVTASGVAEEITDRGRVVAVLMPPPEVDGLERLRQAGVTRAADSRLLRAALAQVGSIPSLDLAGALAEQRDNER